MLNYIKTEQIDKWQSTLFVVFAGLSNNQGKMALCYVYKKLWSGLTDGSTDLLKCLNRNRTVLNRPRTKPLRCLANTAMYSIDFHIELIK